LGFALRSLLAVGGISGIALGLAAKEVVSNFFGGLVLFLTRPFVIGERIKAGAISGQVTDIGYMQTKVLGFDGTPLLVPNQAFINQVITNFSRANSKQLEASFYVHNQDIFLVNKITENVVEYLKTHRQVDKIRSTPQCYLNTMGYWGPEIVILCTINFGGGTFFTVRQEIMVEVAKIVSDVLGEESPYFRNSVSNLLWELRMHLFYAGQSAPSGK
jgi:MscS family membrane protein